jgi:putative copper resistance protein D
MLALAMVLAIAPWFSPSVLPAQYHDGESDTSHGAAGHAQTPAKSSQWEGSAEGKAYSEFSHQISALCVLLIGFGELRSSLGVRGREWGTYLLPGALMAAGLWLLIWSDHDAWPVGHMSFLDAFAGTMGEIAQHKQYGLLALSVGAIELIRRRGILESPHWLFPLPLFAIVGGLMLFSHDHGAHPAAQHIAIHHALMGSAAVAAGLTKALASWNAVRQVAPMAGTSLERPDIRTISRWELAWSLLVLVIGLQLLLYRE